MQNTQRRSESVTFAVTEDERKKIAEKADEQGLTMSSLIRQKVIYGE